MQPAPSFPAYCLIARNTVHRFRPHCPNPIMTSPTSDSMRLFFALWPDDATRTSLMQLQHSMHGKRVPFGNLHLTLAFLGQQPRDTVAVLEDAMTHLPPLAVTLNVDRIGYFTRHRIAWAGMHETPVTLVTLHEELAHALADRQIRYNGQHHFKPHITLARDAEMPPDLVFGPIVWRAETIALVRSRTHAEGADYDVLSSRSLERRFWTPVEARGNLFRA